MAAILIDHMPTSLLRDRFADGNDIALERQWHITLKLDPVPKVITFDCYGIATAIVST